MTAQVPKLALKTDDDAPKTTDKQNAGCCWRGRKVKKDEPKEVADFAKGRAKTYSYTTPDTK